MSKFKEVDNAFKRVHEAFDKLRTEENTNEEIRAIRALIRVDNSNGCYHKEMIDFIPEQIWNEIIIMIYNWKREWVASTETHEDFKKSCSKLSTDKYEEIYKDLFNSLGGSVNEFKEKDYVPKQIVLETEDSFIFRENYIEITTPNGDKVELEKGLFQRIKKVSLS